MTSEQDQMMQKRLKEMMEFFEFSIRPDADFTGAISFCLATNSNKTYSFTIRILDDNGEKIAVAKLGIERPTTVVTMSASDFFYVYSGEASAYEVTKMIIRRRINVENYEIHRVNHFAQSFDYSSSKWDAYYHYVSESNNFKQSIRQLLCKPSFSNPSNQLRLFSSSFPNFDYPTFPSPYLLQDYQLFPRVSFPLWRPTTIYIELSEDDFRIEKKYSEHPTSVSEATYWYIQQQLTKHAVTTTTTASPTRIETKNPSMFKQSFKPLLKNKPSLLFRMNENCQFSPLRAVFHFQLVKSIKTYCQRMNDRVRRTDVVRE